MKRLSAVLIVFILIAALLPAHGESPADNIVRSKARERLQGLGYRVSDEMFERTCADVDDFIARYAETDFYSDFFGELHTVEGFAYQIIVNAGMGEYDYDELIRTPTSDKVYVFDSEVFNVEGMYAEFFQGIDAIIPDAEFSEVTESHSDTYSESYLFAGSVPVSFKCNGNTYSTNLKEYYDWLDAGIIDYVNEVLEKENCSDRLQSIMGNYDQIFILIYGNEKDADALRKVLGKDDEYRALAESFDSSGDSLFFWFFGG